MDAIVADARVEFTASAADHRATIHQGGGLAAHVGAACNEAGCSWKT